MYIDNKKKNSNKVKKCVYVNRILQENRSVNKLINFKIR